MPRWPRQLASKMLAAGLVLGVCVLPGVAWAYLGSCPSEAGLFDLPSQSPSFSMADAWVSGASWNLADGEGSEDAVGEGMTCADGISCVFLKMKQRSPRPVPSEGPVCRPGDPHCEMTPGLPMPAVSGGTHAAPMPSVTSALAWRWPVPVVLAQSRHAVEPLLRSFELIRDLERPPRR